MAKADTARAPEETPAPQDGIAPEQRGKFNVKKHLIKVQGGREYLPVAYRLVWFREEHPDWGIETKPIVCDVEKGIFVWHARITNSEARVVSEGTKMETVRGFADAAEKAETGAIGRALGVLGFGTQFAPEFDEGERIVDRPQPLSSGRPGAGRPSPTEARVRPSPTEARVRPSPTGGTVSVGFATCAECGRPLTKGQADYSNVRFGRPLCPSHQAGAKAEAPAQPNGGVGAAQPNGTVGAAQPGKVTAETFDSIRALCDEQGWDADISASNFTRAHKQHLGDLTEAEASDMLSAMRACTTEAANA